MHICLQVLVLSPIKSSTPCWSRVKHYGLRNSTEYPTVSFFRSSGIGHLNLAPKLCHLCVHGTCHNMLLHMAVMFKFHFQISTLTENHVTIFSYTDCRWPPKTRPEKYWTKFIIFVLMKGKSSNRIVDDFGIVSWTILSYPGWKTLSKTTSDKYWTMFYKFVLLEVITTK